MLPNSPERHTVSSEVSAQLMTDVEDVAAHQFLWLRLPAQIEFEQIVDELFEDGIVDFDVLACVLEEWFTVKRNKVIITCRIHSSLQISSYFFCNGIGLKEVDERQGRSEIFFCDEA